MARQLAPFLPAAAAELLNQPDKPIPHTASLQDIVLHVKAHGVTARLLGSSDRPVSLQVLLVLAAPTTCRPVFWCSA